MDDGIPAHIRVAKDAADREAAAAERAYARAEKALAEARIRQNRAYRAYEAARLAAF